ncbi:cell division protein FtsQ/DivIB [Roseovarius pelagicus]|uniref:Cell division protein FtsQ n=1 Tax=Roseovarius pelagicus TaxID=2980108 RepID=A0ABY6DDH4_9RHOB|nr:cell division protein FtsQ/DivIB [Roseovarius pelagicus]UXX84209.1 cell division protein FtsQ/DivIB [Roseovarius pelagicus]
MPEMKRRAGRAQISRSDPAPSRWSYRVHRILLTPLYRRLLRFGIPFTICFVGATSYLSQAHVQQKIWLTAVDLREQFETRSEFMVKLLAVEGASTAVAEAIHDGFPYRLPASSFDMELDDVRRAVENLPAVASAAVRLRQGGVLEVRVQERQPVALLRTRAGLQVIDIDGVVIGVAPSRAARPDLPVLTGKGADVHVAEALEIRNAAGPLRLRLRGLVRMGERRWDVVLDRDQRIMLPVENPIRALERVIVLNESQEMLERDIAAVDMRLAARPTLRMRERAVESWWSVRNMGVGQVSND